MLIFQKKKLINFYTKHRIHSNRKSRSIFRDPILEKSEFSNRHNLSYNGSNKFK